MTPEQLKAMQESLEFWRPGKHGFKVGTVSHTTVYMNDGSVVSFTQIEASRRRDGVWEMAE